ncbi:MAG: carboxypeptidase regulatory-like domain-containing protein, partial [Planctomycetes bacterium]|nr:carboxypeptidase regulatory-like domain-containing protein [Planctomycetota bacterium]
MSVDAGDGAVRSTVTSAAGAFSFRPVAAARVVLTAAAVGFDRQQRSIDLLPREPTYVEIVLRAGLFEVAGTITDIDDDRPIEQAIVEVVEQPGLQAVTDANGRYRITGIDQPRFTLRASCRGYRPLTSPLLTGTEAGATWDAGLTPSSLRIRLRLGGAVAGAGAGIP